MCQILQLCVGNVIHLQRLSHAGSSCRTRAGWKRIHGRISKARAPIAPFPSPPFPPTPSIFFSLSFGTQYFRLSLPLTNSSAVTKLMPLLATHYCKETIKLLSMLGVLLSSPEQLFNFLLQEWHIWLEHLWVILNAGVPGRHLRVSSSCLARCLPVRPPI